MKYVTKIRLLIIASIVAMIIGAMIGVYIGNMYGKIYSLIGIPFVLLAMWFGYKFAGLIPSATTT